MISDHEAKIIGEGNDAQKKVYDEFAESCEDRSRELGPVGAGATPPVSSREHPVCDSLMYPVVAHRVETILPPRSPEEGLSRAATGHTNDWQAENLLPATSA